MSTQNSNENPEKKGRATPKRKDAQAKRVVNSLAPAKNKGERKAQKENSRLHRAQARGAYMRGDENALPNRDRGPIRKYVRDLVDARRSVGEYFLPMLIFVLIVSRITSLQVVAVLLMYFIMISAIVDWYVLRGKVRREVLSKFPESSTKGLGMYAWSRSTQLRRLRAPRPNTSPAKGFGKKKT